MPASYQRYWFGARKIILTNTVQLNKEWGHKMGFGSRPSLVKLLYFSLNLLPRLDWMEEPHWVEEPDGHVAILLLLLLNLIRMLLIVEFFHPILEGDSFFDWCIWCFFARRFTGEHVQLTNDGQSVFLKKTPRRVEEIVSWNKFRCSKTFWVPLTVTEHLLLVHINNKGFFTEWIEQSEGERGRNRSGLLVPSATNNKLQ